MEEERDELTNEQHAVRKASNFDPSNQDELLAKPDNFSENVGAITSNQFRSGLPVYVQILIIVTVAAILALMAVAAAAVIFRWRRRRKELKSKCEKDGTSLKSVAGKVEMHKNICNVNMNVMYVNASLFECELQTINNNN